MLTSILLSSSAHSGCCSPWGRSAGHPGVSRISWLQNRAPRKLIPGASGSILRAKVVPYSTRWSSRCQRREAARPCLTQLHNTPVCSACRAALGPMNLSFVARWWGAESSCRPCVPRCCRPARVPRPSPRGHAARERCQRPEHPPLRSTTGSLFTPEPS